MLHRKIKENKYWLEPRKFSKLEAWIDILLRASHADNEFMLGNATAQLKAGQFITSQVKLAEAWGWNREKVSIFLKSLKKDEQADTKTSNKYSLITVLNWSVYQSSGNENPTAQPTSIPATKRQQNSIKSSTINNEKNEKNEKNKLDDKPYLDFSYLEPQTLKNLLKTMGGDKEALRHHLRKMHFFDARITEAFEKAKIINV